MTKKLKPSSEIVNLLARTRMILRRSAYKNKHGERMFSASIEYNHVVIDRLDVLGTMSLNPPGPAMQAKFAAMMEELGVEFVSAGYRRVAFKLKRAFKTGDAAKLAETSGVPVSAELVKAAKSLEEGTYQHQADASIASEPEPEPADPRVAAANASQLAEAYGLVLAATLLALPDQPVEIEIAMLDAIPWPDAVPRAVRETMEHAVIDRIRHPVLSLGGTSHKAIWESMQTRVKEVAQAAYTMVRYGSQT